SEVLSSLDIGPAGLVRLTPGRDKVLDVGSLSVASDQGARLDLADNWMIVRSKPGERAAVLQTLASLISSAKGNGDFKGPGIGTSIAAAGSGMLVGVIPNITPSGKPLYAQFAGRPVDENCILVAYTYAGDLDLDGDVDADDYARLKSGLDGK